MSEKKVTLVIGKRGSGKSYLVKKLIGGETPKERLLVYDPQSEYSEGVCFDRDSYGQLLEFWWRVRQTGFRIVYRPIDPAGEIDDIAKLVFALGNMTFVVEEVEAYCNTFNINQNFAAILQRGRHRNIELIGVTQRPFGIHRLLTSQAKEVYVFNTNEPRDRQYLRDLLGFEVGAKLDILKQFEYVKWEDGSDKLEIGKA